jgi:hypothetical protein
MWSNDYDVIRCETDMMWSRYDDVINWQQRCCDVSDEYDVIWCEALMMIR